MAMRTKDYEDLVKAAFGSDHGLTIGIEPTGGGHRKITITDGKRRGQVVLGSSPRQRGAGRRNMVMEIRHCWRDARPVKPL